VHYLLIAAIAFCLASGVLSALDAAAGNPMRGAITLAVSLTAASGMVFLVTDNSTTRIGAVAGTAAVLVLRFLPKSSIYRRHTVPQAEPAP
jgi:hypothetical protein